MVPSLRRRRREKPVPIANFGEFQSKLEKYAKSVESINILHGISSEGNYYLIIFESQNEARDKRSWKFTAKILENTYDPTKASIVHRWAEKPRRHRKKAESHELPTLQEDFSYHVTCARWIMSILCEYDFELKSMDVMLPPRCDLGRHGVHNYKLAKLEITLETHEKDAGIVDWWLSEFNVRASRIKINTLNLQVQLKNNEHLKNTEEVVVFGKSDIDMEWIHTSNIHIFTSKHDDTWNLTDREILEFCVRYNNAQIVRKKLILFQGTFSKERGKQLTSLLRNLYSDHTKIILFFHRNICEDYDFRFKMSENHVEFGKYSTKRIPIS